MVSSFQTNKWGCRTRDAHHANFHILLYGVTAWLPRCLFQSNSWHVSSTKQHAPHRDPQYVTEPAESVAIRSFRKGKRMQQKSTFRTLILEISLEAYDEVMYSGPGEIRWWLNRRGWNYRHPEFEGTWPLSNDWSSWTWYLSEQEKRNTGPIWREPNVTLRSMMSTAFYHFMLCFHRYSRFLKSTWPSKADGSNQTFATRSKHRWCHLAW